MKHIKYTFLLPFICCILFSQEPRNIRIAFDHDFWGTLVKYVKLDSIHVFFENQKLISSEVLDFADEIQYSTNLDSLVFEAKMFHFKGSKVKNYYFKIPIKGKKVVQFFMAVDSCSCERVLHYKTWDKEYYYD